MKLDESQIAELEAIRAADPAGLLKAEAVVERAKDPASTLHGLFLWDKDQAAMEHWLSQARQVIRCWVYHEPLVRREVRAVVSVPSDRADGGGYRQTRQVITDVNWLAQLVDEALGHITRLKDRYEHLVVLDPLWPRLEMAVAEFKAEAVKVVPAA